MANTAYQQLSPSCSTRAKYKTKKLSLKKCWENCWVKKAGDWTISKKITRLRAKGRGRKMRDEIGKGNQMTALRFQTEGYPSDIPGLPLVAPRKKKTASERRGLVAENARAGPFKLQGVDHFMIRVTRKHAASWAWCTQVIDHLQKEAQSWKRAKRPPEHEEQKKTSMQANQRNGHVFFKMKQNPYPPEQTGQRDWIGKVCSTKVPRKMGSLTEAKWRPRGVRKMAKSGISDSDCVSTVRTIGWRLLL